MALLDNSASFSALIAPVIDRTAISVHNFIEPEALGALRGEHRFHPSALALFGGMLCAGPISNVEFAELTRYQHFGSPKQFLVGLGYRGAITFDADGFVATSDGLQVAQQVVVLQVDAVTKLFAPRQASLDQLLTLISRSRNAAVADPISILSRLSGRAWLPEDASDAARIWDCSVVLRMHRSDAHATAWKEAGRTAGEMRLLGPGQERQAIEERTNELAATPWVGLSADERLVLIAGLGALPGTGAPI